MTTDLTGVRFGQLVVLAQALTRKNRAYWLCVCDCGVHTVKRAKYLLNGDTTSCGCAQRAYRASGHRKYGDLTRVHKREYSIWRSMKSRCYVSSSSNYRFYGARGTTICDRWRDDFAAFVADMGPCPDGQTVERKDHTGHYEPDNCRWATWDEQHNNTKRNRFYDWHGERLTLAQIARLAGVNYMQLFDVLRDGSTIDDAVHFVTQHPRVHRARAGSQAHESSSPRNPSVR